MTIVIVPPYPQRNSPNFADEADSWNAQLPTWTDQVNATAVDVTNKQIAAAASELAAELAETNAEIAQAASEAARDISIANASGTVVTGSAKDWASKAEDSEVITGYYSALHWATKAAASVASLPAGTINDLLTASDKTWSSNKISAEILLGKVIGIENKTGIYTVLETDRAKLIRCSGSFNLNFSSAAVLGTGFFCYAQNVGGLDVTIEPYNTETIDGVANVVLEPDNLFLIISDGTNLKCCRLNKPKPHYITSSQTWISPAGVYEIDVELWGAGASGGKTGSSFQGIGGGGGSYARKKIQVTPGTSKSITIGTGGARQTSSSTNGNNGGSSSFSTDITCSGGSGGTYNTTTGAYSAAGSGATSTGGDINVSGGKGFMIKHGEPVPEGLSSGGTSFGTPAAISKSDSFENGIFPGGGGTGTTSSVNSGSGANGLCIIWY